MQAGELTTGIILTKASNIRQSLGVVSNLSGNENFSRGPVSVNELRTLLITNKIDYSLVEKTQGALFGLSRQRTGERSLGIVFPMYSARTGSP